MISLKLIQHDLATPSEIDKIIRIKSIAWPYTYQQQKQWIDSNLKDSDIHVFLLQNEQPVAYLNLIDIQIFINEKEQKAFGIGNVCSVEKGKGYGVELIRCINSFLTDQNMVGLLFCKKQLVSFYKRSKWVILSKDLITVPFNNQEIVTMSYNISQPVQHLKYDNKLF